MRRLRFVALGFALAVLIAVALTMVEWRPLESLWRRFTSVPKPSLSFPVSGGDAANIQSVYGDQRDAGRRSHEGIDIFAARGTPVLAASDGSVTQVGQNRLGGNVVWVWNPSRGRVSLRASPSSDSAVVEVLPAARPVRIEGVSGPWVRTTAGGQLAYVKARDLHVVRPR